MANELPSPIVATRSQLALARIVPDSRNRPIEEDDEFRGLVDSIRVLGVLQPIHVRERSDESFDLIDGERRWRAAKAAGLSEVPCEVWPADSSPRDAQLAGVVLNEQRKAHSPIYVARRLHEIKNDYALTIEQLGTRTGMPADRVKSYLALLNASESLLEFLATAEVPVKVALEMVRYEKATDSRRTERLLERYAESPLTRHQIAAMRKKAQEPGAESLPTPIPNTSLCARIEKAFARDAQAALSEIEIALGKFGYEVVLAGAQGS